MSAARSESGEGKKRSGGDAGGKIRRGMEKQREQRVT